MAGSPFAGTELEDFWRQRFIAGWLAPNDDHQAPSPLTPDQQDALFMVMMPLTYLKKNGGNYQLISYVGCQVWRARV
jgi:hypothetical protein